MAKPHSSSLPVLGACLLSIGACAEEPEFGTVQHALEVECVEPTGDAPADQWVCGEPLTVECTAELTPVDVIYAKLREGSACASTTLSVSDAGPYPLGSHAIDIRATPDMPRGADSELLCSSTLTVEDTTAPQPSIHTVTLWPPNHQLHTVVPTDCVTLHDACDPDVQVVFTSASSDEPDDASGDGAHEPDIERLDCDSVQLRAERQGLGDGRLYTLGWRAYDASGNVAEGLCRVVVPHDESADPVVDSGAAYTLVPDLTCGPAMP